MRRILGSLLILLLAASGRPLSAQSADDEDLPSRLAREESTQKRARRIAEQANRELADLAQQIRDHRLKPTAELLSVDPSSKSLTRISTEQMPQVEKGLYLARTEKDLSSRAAALTSAVREQESTVRQLQDMLGQLSRAAATGASLHRAEKILRDQMKLNGEMKTSLREGFSKALAGLPESLRQGLVRESEEQLRIGREVVLLDGELQKAEQSGPARQQSGIKAARAVIFDKKLTILAQEVSDQLAVNNAAAAAGGTELEAQFKALVAALQAATAGAEAIAGFDLLGPSLAELAAKDAELKALLDKLNKMIKEAQLLKKPPEKEELRKLRNMQEELNNMLVEIKRDIPNVGDDELIAKLKEMLQNAFAAMEVTGEGIDKGDAEAIIHELKVTLANLVLAEEELKALLATLAALQAGKGKPNENEQETPAGIALGLGLRLGGNTTGASGPGGVLNPGKHARELGPQDWGRLPPAIRDQLIQAVKESFPPEYADLIEQYYRDIARNANSGK